MRHLVTTSVEDLVSFIVPDGHRTLHLTLDGYRTELDEVGPDLDAVVAVGVLEGILPDDEYAFAVRRMIGALKPGGVLVVCERNPIEGADANPASYAEGDVLPRGMIPIYAQHEVDHMQVLGQEFDGSRWCAGFWMRPCPGLRAEDGSIVEPGDLVVQPAGGGIELPPGAGPPKVIAPTQELLRRATEGGFVRRLGDEVTVRLRSGLLHYRIIGWRERGTIAVCALEESA